LAEGFQRRRLKSIQINNQTIQDVDLESLRKAIGVVPQVHNILKLKD
jgi:ABC-type transport system involved in Fe-S cluster assembly fused permease/ATPase subunit